MDTNTPDEIVLYTPKALAKKLGLTYRLIREAINSGELEITVLSPRRRRIRSEAAAAWFIKKTRRALIATK